MKRHKHRLPPRASQQIDQGQVFTFRFDGQSVDACAGDTIASALVADGHRILSRSFKYHRPRGLLCCSGDCPNCMVQVNGRPNVRACITRVEDGMQVCSQRGWPSVEHDLLRSIEAFEQLLPIGFYYKTLYKRPWLWKLVEPVIRNLAGLGQVNRESEHGDFQHCYEYVDVLVVGGGPAGMEAATQAAAAGLNVMLVEGEERLGGHLNYETRTYSLEISRPGYQTALGLKDNLRSKSNVRVLTEAFAFGCYEGMLIPVLQGGERVVHVRTKALIVATGCRQYAPVFSNNDLPGVMLSRGALRLINVYGVKPGSKVLIYTSDDEGYFAAIECLEAGIKPVGIVDARHAPSSFRQVAELRAEGVEIWNGMTVLKANGIRGITSATIAPRDASQTGARRIECDTLLLATAWEGNSSLLTVAGCQMSFSPAIGQSIPTKMSPGVFAAGEVLGLRSLPQVLQSGTLAGKAAAEYLQGGRDSWFEDIEPLFAEARNGEHACAVPAPDRAKKGFVCFCEDVTEQDLKQGVQEGFDEIETLKRYSTVSMGPCQGKMCARNASEICGVATGREYAGVGTSTVRPPIRPVPLGALAGSEFHPFKVSSMHHKHATLAREFVDLGVWKRPFIYSSVEEEYDAVRNRAGLIDISSLGKLAIKGVNAPDLLDKVYTHWFSTLKPGRARYGVICDESGVILDDGTVACLTKGNYYVTTSTGNVDSVEQWLKWWVVSTGWCVHVVNLTSSNAALNLAGPAAREILAPLTSADLSASAFPYMACREAEVAGIPMTLLRVGFVGETGWELHFPAEFGEYMWDTLLEAGRSRGIKPFGVETQRVLRLEKKHIIVGQDTDALANPYDSDMGWVVKLEKPDFIGRHSLEKASRALHANRLVGFVARGGPELRDGCAIVVDGKLVGRITSVRFSPHAKNFVGLAWVPTEYAAQGSQITLYAEGKNYPAVVVDGAFYDPEGTRLK
jgi:sarcosine oxidase subunit alpha